MENSKALCMLPQHEVDSSADGGNFSIQASSMIRIWAFACASKLIRPTLCGKMFERIGSVWKRYWHMWQLFTAWECPKYYIIYVCFLLIVIFCFLHLFYMQKNTHRKSKQHAAYRLGKQEIQQTHWTCLEWEPPFPRFGSPPDSLLALDMHNRSQ